MKRRQRRSGAGAQRRRGSVARVFGVAVVLGLLGAQATRPASGPATRPAGEGNPAAPGFDTQGSDPRAIAIADAVMKAMGGRGAWDATRYVTWRFGPRRRHLWDRHAGRLRLEGRGPRTAEPYVMLIDLAAGTGRAWKDGREVTTPDELAGMIDAGIGYWINDSYWLVMPYKLKDSGVTLGYVGEGETEDGRAADVLSLTFRDVGRTPANKYHVWVARDSGLVAQWAFYQSADDPEPAFVCPWRNWTRHGRVLLSDDRGELRGRPFRLEDVAVLEAVPDAAFERPDPVDWERLYSTSDTSGP